MLFVTLKLVTCPEQYPWAYLSGQYCCKTRMEGVDAADGERCDGGQLQYDSSCCLGRNNKCYNPPCQNRMSGNIFPYFCLDFFMR